MEVYVSQQREIEHKAKLHGVSDKELNEFFDMKVKDFNFMFPDQSHHCK